MNGLVAVTGDITVHKCHVMGGKSTFLYQKNAHTFIKLMSRDQHTAVLITVPVLKSRSFTPAHGT